MQQAHSITPSAADKSAWASLYDDDSLKTSGRHPHIATAENSRASVLAADFNGLSLDVLASIGVDAGQRISATLMPVNETPDPVYASDRAAYVARLDRDCDAHLRKLNALSACITQLVALEHVYLERVDAMIESVSQYPNVGTATAKTSSE
jgi:hypothetical protein